MTLAVSFATVGSGHAFAQNTDGNALLEACQAPADIGLRSFCVGYIIGTWEGMNWGSFMTWRAAAPDVSTEQVNKLINGSLQVCATNEVQNSQIVDVVVNFLVEHPESRHEAARGLINQALMAAFPCSSKP